MSAEHRYAVDLRWKGNLGEGTSGYRAYGRDHEVRSGAKPVLLGSADAAFRGDPARWNPEDLLVASLSQCHLLTYLHACADAGVVVVEYVDTASGVMTPDSVGGGRFTEVVLRPVVTVAEASMAEDAQRLHEDAHDKCYIASSVNFPVRCHASTRVVGDHGA